MDSSVHSGLVFSATLRYICLVRETLKDDQDNYARFLKLMKYFQLGRIRHQSFIRQMCGEVFKDHVNLRKEFCRFLPLDLYVKYVKRVCEEEIKTEAFAKLVTEHTAEQIDIQQVRDGVMEIFKGNPAIVEQIHKQVRLSAVAFVNSVKETFEFEKEKFDKFSVLLHELSQEIDVATIRPKVETLFEDHPLLMESINRFLPENDIHSSHENEDSHKELDKELMEWFVKEFF